MRAARILQEDPNPSAKDDLLEYLKGAAAPVTPIQSQSDTTSLRTLRIAQGKFQEKKRLYDLSREARLLRDEPGWIKLKVVRPRVQMQHEEKFVRDAYVDFIVEVAADCRGADLKSAILRKQEALVLPVFFHKFTRLFVHELGGRNCSPYIGREILDARQLGEYGVFEGLSYDVTVWQNQSLLEARTVATLLLVDARPGVMLDEQASYIDDCRAKEAPCYTGLS
mmetsp:Transcript_26983/g.60352  ORF Transcript_26983/g.60352 Transcript_26983/m.60352 type:complete len:224 (+) Transcript_26983:178-849(+)|eukprot:CAMPEP_0172583600 /NCGR_PEP_ID=MMETSP1068-20121228/3216_1 /TAXON_ID=35684 /ORGANISM="Pseudopedinella elastica, Strain CCMP716" /LENGTH=223 /DNA_ID=CAMNT_0013377463 /DNA_START=141 /DNA_END=812 /DNA_ORIENTATION=-